MWSVIVAGYLVAASAAGQERSAAEGELPLADSQSVGHTEEGRLEGAFALEDGDHLAVVRPHRFGTREMVGLLQRAAAAVARAAPGSKLAVGDLSAETGGPLAPHVSHQNGRDADVGFYLIDAADGRPVPQALFTEIAADGTARRGERRFVFDDARNWALLVALVDDPMAEVQHVLLVAHLRERLFAYARSIAAPEDQIRRVELVTDPIRGSERHDDHFHVRIYCPVGDRPQCLDRPPLHPWYDGTPSPHAVAAARAADALRAAALRRDQDLQRQAEAALAAGRRLEEAREEIRARQLAAEDQRQAAAERQRAAVLSADERRAVAELRRMEAEAARQRAQVAAGERGRYASLVAGQRRWEQAERRRAARLRAAERARQDRELRAREREDDRLRAALLRRADAQLTADQRRAALLLRRAERLQRARYPRRPQQ